MRNGSSKILGHLDGWSLSELENKWKNRFAAEKSVQVGKLAFRKLGDA